MCSIIKKKGTDSEGWPNKMIGEKAPCLLFRISLCVRWIAKNRTWISVVCTFIDNDTRHQSDQNVVDSQGVAEWILDAMALFCFRLQNSRIFCEHERRSQYSYNSFGASVETARKNRLRLERLARFTREWSRLRRFTPSPIRKKKRLFCSLV